MPFKVRTIKPADKMVDDLIKGVSQSADKWLEGYENPSADPQGDPEAAEAAWEVGVQAAADRKALQKGLENYDADAAIETARTIGKTNLVSGVKAREKKIRTAFRQLAPKIEKVALEVRGMPAVTAEDRKQRMIKNLELMTKIGTGET